MQVVDTQFTPRFIHIVDEFVGQKFSGMTVAYIRYDDVVVFGYTLCSVNDQYRKSTGRELSLKALDKSSDMRVLNKNITKMVDTKNCTGYIDITVFKDFANTANALSDQLLAAMGMFDFKHAFISGVIADTIAEMLFDENW